MLKLMPHTILKHMLVLLDRECFLQMRSPATPLMIKPRHCLSVSFEVPGLMAYRLSLPDLNIRFSAFVATTPLLSAMTQALRLSLTLRMTIRQCGGTVFVTRCFL